jgi:hypothetical protein
VKLRQLLWTVVFLGDRGADEPRRWGWLLAVAAIAIAAWLLLWHPPLTTIRTVGERAPAPWSATWRGEVPGPGCQPVGQGVQR